MGGCQVTHNMEVITTTDKDVRNRLFEDLRMNGSELEKQVVKFSGVEPQFCSKGEPLNRVVQYSALGKGGITRYGNAQFRQVYRSTWSVAYPKS